ncbi:MAG: acyl-CoA dehydrogenase family protein [Proteobacteria bacterium]|nr:acyl-CoA dehydrogenase family protein [Pseudomonadota bacterium]
MDLSYGDEYEALRGELRQFLTRSWPLQGEEAKLGFPEQAALFRKRATEAGYLNRSIPKRYGGSEQPADVLTAQVIREEFGRAKAPGEARGIGTMMLVPTLLERGEEWQKEKWIPGSISGEITWCQGYSEPGSGSDLASLKTRGELVGDEWVINGQKIWTSGAQRADFMFCLTRTEPDAPKHAGISYLLIDMKQPGVDVRPLKQMTGGATFNEVFLNDVRAPADWIVGKRGEGWIVSRTTLKHERNSIGAATQTSVIFTALVRLAQRVEKNGAPAIRDPVVRQRLATLEGYVRAHQYSGYYQLTRDSKGESAGLIPLMNKLIGTTISQEAGKIGYDLVGEDALLAAGERTLGLMPKGNQGWVAQFMSSLGGSIAGGTANIQRNIIAERGLGLPRDAAADRSAGK